MKLLAKHQTTVTPAQIAGLLHRRTVAVRHARSRATSGSSGPTTQGQADAAKAALASGQSWDDGRQEVLDRPATKNNGGLLTGVTKGQEERRSTPPRSRPPRTRCSARSTASSATTCSRSRRSSPATQQTLAQATPLIQQMLQGQQQTNAQTAVDNAGQEELAQQDEVPHGVRDGRLQRLQGAEDDDDGTATAPRTTGSAGDADDHVVVDHEEVAPVRSGPPEIQQALARLDAITRRLRRECPWDREQDERTIVPHTRRGGLRARRRGATGATTPSCSTSSATSCSRCTSCRCCSRSAAPATSRRSPSTAPRS